MPNIVPAKGLVQSFNFNGCNLRVVDQNGEPWFVAKDVADILDLSDVSMMCLKLREKDKGTSKICTLGGDQNFTVISESALYRITLRSNKSQAELFQDWVCDEVLPTIRKTGKFVSHFEFDDDLFEVRKRELKAAQTELMEVQTQAIRFKTSKLKQALEAKPRITKNSSFDQITERVAPMVEAFCKGKPKVSTAEILEYLGTQSVKPTLTIQRIVISCLKQLGFEKDGSRHKIQLEDGKRLRVWTWLAF